MYEYTIILCISVFYF